MVPTDRDPPDAASGRHDETARLNQALALLQQHAPQLGEDIVERAAQPLRQRLQMLADAAAPALPRLRQVSVLFVDIVGSTRLLQALDAEDAHAVVDGALRRFGEAVERHGGQVLRFLGDGLKAAFGLPEPADDDALRAVRAALAVLAEAQAHAADVAPRLQGQRFQVRCGLHTGPVALGAGAEGAQTLVGATVHLAARMEQNAEPGSLRVSQSTWRLARGAFDYEVLAPIQVKGVPDPVQTYRMLGERPPGERRSGRGIDGLEIDLIGRAAPRAALMAAVRALRPEGHAQVVSVTGDAGVGKSRLRAALLHDLAVAEPPLAVQVLPGQAWPETEGTPWGLLRDLLLRHAGLNGREPAPEASARLQDVLLPLLAQGAESEAGDETADSRLAAPRAQALAYAIGLLDAPSMQASGLTHNPGALRQVVQQASLAWLRGLLRVAPVLVLLDDLHWADDDSLDLIAMWQRELAAQPLGLVLLARPVWRQRRPQWLPAGAGVQHIELAELDADAVHSLIDALLARLRPVPTALRQALVDRSGGNPYFIEEMVGALISSGALDTRGELWHWHAPDDGAEALPGTLAGMLQARVGRLDPVQRLALQQAAVVGPRVPDHVLAAIDPAALPVVPALVAQGLLVPELGGAWRFHHQLLQQAAYDSVLRSQRQPWHARVAAHLASREDSPAFWVAEHFERAGDAAAAAGHYRLAALETASRSPRTQLRHAARRALALSPEADAAWCWPLHQVIANTSLLMRDLDAVREVVEPMRALAEAMDDDGRRADAERAAVGADDQLQSPERMAVVVALAERAHVRHPSEQLPRMLGLLAWALVNSGRVAEARRVAERGIALATEPGFEPGIDSARACLESAGVAAWKLGDLSAGLALMQQAHRVARGMRDPGGEISSLCNLAGMARTLGDRQTWAASVEEALHTVERTGLTYALPLLRVRRAQGLLHDGLAEQAGAELQRALALLPPEDRWFRITALLATGHVHLAQAAAVAAPEAGGAERAAARSAFEQALAGAVDAGMRAEAQQGLVLAALACGEPLRACQHAEALLVAMADPQPGDATERPAQWLAVADARRAAGDARGADQALGTARRELLEQAARIGDVPARERFLADVAHNRRILEASVALQADLGADTPTG